MSSPATTRVARYTTSAFTRAQIGDALSARHLAPHLRYADRRAGKSSGLIRQLALHRDNRRHPQRARRFLLSGRVSTWSLPEALLSITLGIEWSGGKSSHVLRLQKGGAHRYDCRNVIALSAFGIHGSGVGCSSPSPSITKPSSFDRQEKLRNLVESAHATVAHFEEAGQDGEALRRRCS